MVAGSTERPTGPSHQGNPGVGTKPLQGDAMTDPIAAARDIAKRFIADVQKGVLSLGKEAENILTEAIASALAAAEARVREGDAKKCDALQEAALRRASEPGATQNYATHQQAVADSARECAAAIRCGGVRHLSAE